MPTSAGATAEREAVSRFDEFELNWNTRELFRQGDSVAVEPKTLELIHYLLLHRDRAVSRDELAEALWPGRVISDTVISQIVRKARAAVGDDGERQEVIATVRGFGYRFVAAVREVDSPAAQATSDRPMSRRRRTGVLAIVGLVFLSLFVWLHDPRPAQAPELRTAAIVPGASLDDAAAPSWLAEAVTNVVQSVLTESPSWVVVPESAVSAQLAIADDREVGIAGLFDQLGVSHVFDAALAGGDGQWELTLRQRDRAGAAALRRARGDSPLRLALQLARGVSTGASRSEAAPAADWLDDSWLAETYFRGIAAMRQGDADTAAGLFASILEFNPDHVWTRYQLATAFNAQGQYVAAADILESLVHDPLIQADHPQLYRLSANALGVSWWYRGDLDAAAGYFQILADSGRAANHLLNAANGELNLGMVHSTRGAFEQAEAHYIEALALYSRAGYMPGRAHVANALGIQAYRQNRPDLARIWHAEALEVRRALGNQRDISESLFNLGLIASMRLHWDDSERLLEEAIMLARAVNDPARELNYATNLGWNRARTGRVSEGRALLLETMRRAADYGYGHVKTDCLGFLGSLEAMMGDHESALAWLEAALARADVDNRGADLVAVQLNLAQVLLDLDRVTEALDHLNRIAASQLLTHQPGNRSHYLRIRARLAAMADDEDARYQHLNEAVEASRIAGDRNRMLEAHAALAWFYFDRGRMDAADAILDAMPELARLQPEALVLRAELAWQAADAGLAVQLMKSARDQFGERWDSELQSRLELFRAETEASSTS